MGKFFVSHLAATFYGYHISKKCVEKAQGDDVMMEEELTFLQSELDRTVREVRETISHLGAENSAAWILRLSTLLDKIECHVTLEEGDSAFLLDEENGRISFRGQVLAKIWRAMDSHANDVDSTADLTREKQLAINQFIIHELLHIRQNFPHFATVQTVKQGLSGYGLPLLDIGADTASAWMAALVEIDRTKATQAERSLYLLNALLRAYVIGAFVFDSRSKSEKRQRALGLLISAALVHATRTGKLNRQKVYEAWRPVKPVIAFDLSQVDTFNAMVIDAMPGVLVSHLLRFERTELDSLWNGVGEKSVGEMLALVFRFLIAIDAIIP